MVKSRKRTHGEHNESLSKELLGGKKYYDWVITTAFYSVIHLIEDKLLPITINGAQCENISKVRKAYKVQGKHTARERLVSLEASSISTRYKWLDDRSRNARYTTFKITPAEAHKAAQYLNEIKVFCSTDK